jgi:hypothetical protein
VLVYLVQNPGKVIARDELLKNVWPDMFVDENSLAQSISARRVLDVHHKRLRVNPWYKSHQSPISKTPHRHFQNHEPSVAAGVSRKGERSKVVHQRSNVPAILRVSFREVM